MLSIFTLIIDFITNRQLTVLSILEYELLPTPKNFIKRLILVIKILNTLLSGKSVIKLMFNASHAKTLLSLEGLRWSSHRPKMSKEMYLTSRRWK